MRGRKCVNQKQQLPPPITPTNETWSEGYHASVLGLSGVPLVPALFQTPPDTYVATAGCGQRPCTSSIEFPGITGSPDE